MNRSITIILLCVWWALGSAAEIGPALRRPVARDPSADGNWLYVANRDSGTLSVIDLKSRQVASEHKIGQRLTDIAAIPGSSQLLIAAEGGHELMLIAAERGKTDVIQRLPISPYPVSINIAPAGK